jgi:hypothetical protein
MDFRWLAGISSSGRRRAGLEDILVSGANPSPGVALHRICAMGKKQAIAIEIALQTQVLKTCSVHRKLYCDDDVNPANAFALAVELIRQHTPYVEPFHDDAHELIDLLSDTLGATPPCCPECRSPPTN